MYLRFPSGNFWAQVKFAGLYNEVTHFVWCEAGGISAVAAIHISGLCEPL